MSDLVARLTEDAKAWEMTARDTVTGRNTARLEREAADRIEQLEGALKVIDTVIPAKITGNSDAYVKQICRKCLGTIEQTHKG